MIIIISSVNRCLVSFCVIKHYTILKVNTSIIISVDRLAKIDSVAKFFFQNRFTGVSWKFKEKKASVGLGEIVVRRIVFVKNL